MLTDTDTHAFFPDSGTDESRCLSGLLGWGCGGVHPVSPGGLLAAWLPGGVRHAASTGLVELAWKRSGRVRRPLPLSAHEELSPRPTEQPGWRAHRGPSRDLAWPLPLPPRASGAGPQALCWGAWQVAALCCPGLLLLVV